jgi:hypothetical protein
LQVARFYKEAGFSLSLSLSRRKKNMTPYPYPWSWFWAPQIHFPFSGGVAQHIEPNINWFFDAIRPTSGNADIERQAFDIASYGKQLGLITEVLLSMAGEQTVTAQDATKSLTRLKEIYEKIETVKAGQATALADTAVSLLDKLRASDPAQFDRVMARYSI